MIGTLRKGIRIEALEPIITSQGAASAASPVSLPHVPGAMLWGVVAHALYGRGDKATFDLLHAGRLRFDDGLPLSEVGPGFPVPMSLHLLKGKPHSHLATDKVDLTVDAYQPEIRQQRGWAIASGQSEVEVGFVTSMRTSIDPTKGVAAESQLYALHALSSGQQFLAGIEGEADAVETVLEILCGKDGREQVLGRSKSAEFGLCRLSRCEIWDFSGSDAPAAYLWCLSDLAAVDSFGLPTLRPDDDFFDAKIAWNRSFTRHRRYAPWNAKWQSRAPERLVIERGSVFALEDTRLTVGLHRFGLHQESGLGLVLAMAKPPGKFIESLPKSPGKVVRQPKKPVGTSELLGWLEANAKQRGLAKGLEDKVSSLVPLSEWKTRYDLVRDLFGASAGPGPSQWAALATADDPKATLEALRDDSTGKEARTWQARCAAGRGGTFAEAALDALQRLGSVDQFRILAKNIRTALPGWEN